MNDTHDFNEFKVAICGFVVKDKSISVNIVHIFVLMAGFVCVCVCVCILPEVCVCVCLLVRS